ncbi:TPA: SMI1/KNR4 family protein [Neisseria gonorrhoeae]
MIKQNSFVPYPEAMLPKGFKYPQSYLKLAQSTHAINYDEQYSFPWWFENAESNISEVIDIYFEITGIPNLLPFARNQEWAACFDISDKSGNPKIIVVNLNNTKYYETFENFDTWLKEAENDGW